jgi:transcriptional regulator with XRE-family HTH domain
MQEMLSKIVLGHRIKSLRTENGYNQARIAEILNLSRSNYSQIELGYQYPTFNTLILLSQHYRKSYEWFLHGTEETKLGEYNGPYSKVLEELDITLRQMNKSLGNLENQIQHIKKKTAAAEIAL